MKKIVLPIDVKSLYFNIKNDNLIGHTPTVATPIRKIFCDYKLGDVYLLKSNEVDISSKSELIELLVKHSKTKVVIRNVYVFKKISVNGKPIDVNYSFGFYIKEEIDETKVQFGRLKLHYPSKFIYEDVELNINNKKIYEAMSNALGYYAFVVNAFEYIPESETLNFDALIVGENSIPYSKVFINEKGAGNKFNSIFNENADDYDREIISLRKKYGELINPNNYLDFTKEMKEKALLEVVKRTGKKVCPIYGQYPYSIFDFYFEENGAKKYGILRVTATRNKYFNLSLIQQLFLLNNKYDACIYLIYDALETPKLCIYKYENLMNMNKSINSLKYEGG